MSVTFESLLDVVDERTLSLLEQRGCPQGLRRRGSLVRRVLLGSDVLGLTLAFSVSELALGQGARSNGHLNSAGEALLFLAVLPLWIVAATLAGLYDRDEERTDHSTADDFAGVFHLVTGVTWLLVVGAYFAPFVQPEFPKLFSFWASAVVAVPLARAAGRTYCRRQIQYLQNTVIVGAGDVGQLVARKLLSHPEYGLNLVGFVDDAPKERRDDLTWLALLGSRDDLSSIIEVLDVERVIIAFSKADGLADLELVRSLNDLGVQIDVVPRLYEAVTPSVDVHLIEGLPVMSLRPVRLSASARVIKRSMDVVLAALALVILGPLLLALAIWVKSDSSGPILFRQIRLGMDQREFVLFKFRTMHTGTSSSEHEAYVQRAMNGVTAPEDNGLFKLGRSSAVTSAGRWLRMTSLDELPQLINVIRGDMALVGPRPCLPYEVTYFERHHLDRFAVPAGMTGLWQVAARAHSSFREALEMDVAYARGWSVGLDIRLLLRTPIQMVRSRGTA